MYITDRYYQIRQAILDFGARLVVFDTAADTFGGNENDRPQVRRFIGGLAIDIEGSVLLNAHPSRDGLRTGNLDGASTAWNNSVRSRWSLARPTDKDGDEDPMTSERVLTRRKANYAAIGTTIKLKWVNGVLTPITADGGIAGAVHRQLSEIVFLDLLDKCSEQGIMVSHSCNAANHAPKVFAKRPEAQGYSKAEFERAMGVLFSQNKIRNVTYGRSGDARQRIARQGQ